MDSARPQVQPTVCSHRLENSYDRTHLQGWTSRENREVGTDLSFNFLFGFLFPAAHPHRRGGAHRDRSKSRDRLLHSSLEFLSPVVSPLGSGPPSPDVTSCKDSLEDVSADVTQKFKYLGTHDRAQLSPVSSKAAGVRGPSQMRASQEFSEDGDLDDIFSRNRSDSSSSSRASAAKVAQRNEAVAMKMGMEVKGKKEAPDIDRVPFLNSYIDGVTTEKASVSGILGEKFTANDLENLLLLNDTWKSAAKPQDLQTTGRITDSGQDKAFLQNKYGGNPVWASASTHNAPNGSSQIMDETPNVSKSSTSGFAIKPAIAGEKEAVYSGVQSPRSQVLAMPGETTTPVQSNRLPQSPLSSSSHRAAASGSPGKNSTHTSVSPASDSSRMTSDPDECKWPRGLARLECTGKDKRNTMALNHLPENCCHFLASGTLVSTIHSTEGLCRLSGASRIQGCP